MASFLTRLLALRFLLLSQRLFSIELETILVLPLSERPRRIVTIPRRFEGFEV